MSEAGALAEFRAEVRAFLAENYPPSLRGPMTEAETPWGGKRFAPANPDIKLWMDRCAQRGWTVPGWPLAYGGAGLDGEHVRALREEFAGFGARAPLVSMGVAMLGPALLEFASEEQKRHYLPPIARGEIRWCQGYSEPGAGSDLAGLQTRCEDRGDHFLINGQKIWTSYADQADWIFCLVRTDTTRKHDGISFVLFDMTSPGVQARPISLISGSSPFCETFFTDVRVPKDQLVGRLNGGWTIAKRLLEFERQSISSGEFGSITGGAGAILEDLAREFAGVDAAGRIADADLRARIATHKMDMHAFELTVQRLAREAEGGKNVGAAASIVKYATAILTQQRQEMMVEAMGTAGLGWEGAGFAPHALAETRGWLLSKGTSIAGGTSEINLNVVAKRVLGLLDHQ